MIFIWSLSLNIERRLICAFFVVRLIELPKTGSDWNIGIFLGNLIFLNGLVVPEIHIKERSPE